MIMGKCPHCEATAGRVLVEQVVVTNALFGGGNEWRGASYLCAHCEAVLSVSIDPLAIKSEIDSAIDELRGESAAL